MSPQALPAGTSIREDGSYQIVSLLGFGGFGITYKAIHSNIKGRLVAIKEFYPSNFCKRDGLNVIKTPGYTGIFDYDDFRDKFFEEAQRLGKFKHPNIVKILDAFKANNTAYIVMEYEDGETLQQILSKKLYVSETETIKYITKIGQALEYIHGEDTLHRDVKPSNIIIRSNGDPVLLDFGAAREIVDTFDEHTAILSHGFAPPEQYIKSGRKGGFIDVYGLSATGYNCLTGSIPLRADHRNERKLPSPIDLNPTISKSLSDIILKGMSLDVDERYASISPFLYDLTSIPATSTPEVNLTDSQNEALKILSQFLNDPDTNAMILNGRLSSGKTTLIQKLISANTNPRLTFKILSIGSRLAESLTNSCGLDVSSIYGYVYDFANSFTGNDSDNSDIDLEQADFNTTDFKRIYYPLKQNNDRANMVYIIDESQLLSDSLNENDLYVFGSGKLLQDFLQFANVSRDQTRKILFVGDDKRILRGSKDHSSLSKVYLEKTYNLKVKVYELTEPIYTESTKTIVKSAGFIANHVGTGKFNRLKIEDDSKSIMKIDRSQFQDHYSKQSSVIDTICISYSNKQAQAVNSFIRKNIFGRTQTVEKGDVLLFNNTISVSDNQSENPFSTYIHKGELAEILEVGSRESFTQNFRGKKSVIITFINVSAHFPRLHRTETFYLFENFLVSEKDISLEERIALQIKARHNYKKITGQGKVNKTAFLKYIKQDKYYNSAFAKYAYAITCHKAVGFKWKYAFINCDIEKGKENEDYFRWLYTALGATQKTAYLINYTSISPISKLEWRETVSELDLSFQVKQDIFEGNIELAIPNEAESIAAKFKFNPDYPKLKIIWYLFYQKLKGHSIVIANIEHHNFQEVYTFKKGNDNAKIRFYYTANYRVTRKIANPRNALSDEVLMLLEKNGNVPKVFDNFPETFLSELFLWLKSQFEQESISVLDLAHHSFHEIYQLARTEEFLQLIIHYNAEGFFTTAYVSKYNSPAIYISVKNIIEKKELGIYA